MAFPGSARIVFLLPVKSLKSNTEKKVLSAMRTSGEKDDSPNVIFINNTTYKINFILYY